MFKTALNRTVPVLLAVSAIAATLIASMARAGSFEGAMPPRRFHAVKPLEGMTMDQVQAVVATKGTIPLWHYTQRSPIDGKTYQGMIVGRSPFFGGMRTTAIQVFLVPTIIKTDGLTFDPTALDSACLSNTETPVELTQESPLYNTASYTMNGVTIGTAQYVDAFQRANFFNSPGNVGTTGDRYHIQLKLTTTPTVTLSLSAKESVSGTFVDACNNEPSAIIDLSTFDRWVTKTAIPSLAESGVGPSSFVIFMMHNVVEVAPLFPHDPTSDCCILGYHGAFGNVSSLQTYAVADFDTTGVFSSDSNVDLSDASHETAEWLNDPTGTNPTPLWGHVGQVSGCQNNLEVGDPLSGTNFPPILMPNGFVYDVQELAFFSWFYRLNPSLGAGGLFSDNGTFTSDAGVIC